MLTRPLGDRPCIVLWHVPVAALRSLSELPAVEKEDDQAAGATASSAGPSAARSPKKTPHTYQPTAAAPTAVRVVAAATVVGIALLVARRMR